MLLSLLLFFAGPPPRVAMDTSVARMLAEAQLRHEPKLACLSATYDKTQNTIVFDRMEIAEMCPATAQGMVGFIAEPDKYDPDDVMDKMAAVLRARPALWFAGEIHGVERIFNGTNWQLAPLIWWAVRTP